MSRVARWMHVRFLAAFCAIALTPAVAFADPFIDGLNRNSAPMQSNLIIYGSGFGDVQGPSYVLIGGRLVTILAWTDSAIYVLVNPLAFDPTPVALDTAYPVQVIVEPANKTSNSVYFTITSETLPAPTPGIGISVTSDQPTIDGFQKSTFCSGDFVTIYGSGFGLAEAGSYIIVRMPFMDAEAGTTFQDYSLPAIAWDEHAVTVLLTLPSGAEPGSYTVTIYRSNGKSTSADFTVGICE